MNRISDMPPLHGEDFPGLMKRLRENRKKRVVLSLPAGGAVGVAACMAFFRLTRKLDIPFDEVHGTSAGAGFAAALGLGMSFREMENFCFLSSRMKYFLDFNLKGLSRGLLRRGRLEGLIKGDAFERQLSIIYGGRRFRDCVRDTIIYAEREDSATIVGFNNKDHADLPMHQAVRASASIHLWMKPRVIGGVPFLDGGLLESVPMKRILESHREKFPRKKLLLLVVSSIPLHEHRRFGRGNLLRRMKESFLEKPVRRTFLNEYEELRANPNVDVFIFYPGGSGGEGLFSFHALESMTREAERQFRRLFEEYEAEVNAKGFLRTAWRRGR